MANLTLRRIIYIAISMLITEPEYAGLQWCATILFVCLIPGMINVALRANKERFQNRVELFNEWICFNVALF